MHSDEVTRYVRMPDGTKVVVSCLPLPISEKDDLNARANVRLIAAAPDLLEAAREGLKVIMAFGDGNYGKTETLVRKAIAKAEGHGHDCQR